MKEAALIHESGVLERGQSYSCILGALIYGGIRRQKKKETKGKAQRSSVKSKVS